MMGAGVQGPTSVFPADISDGAAPVLRPAASLMGEQSIHEHCYFFFLSFSSFDAFWAKMSSHMFELI